MSWSRATRTESPIRRLSQTWPSDGPMRDGRAASTRVAARSRPSSARRQPDHRRGPCIASRPAPRPRSRSSSPAAPRGGASDMIKRTAPAVGRGNMGYDGSRRWTARATACAAIATACLVATAAGSGAAVATPTVTAASGGAGVPVLASTAFDLADVGYESSEYLLSGTANAYTRAAPLAGDGKWTVPTGETAPYVTRVVTYRPKNAKKFSGTAVVEWLNVSG